MKNVRGYVTAL